MGSTGGMRESREGFWSSDVDGGEEEIISVGKSTELLIDSCDAFDCSEGVDRMSTAS